MLNLIDLITINSGVTPLADLSLLTMHLPLTSDITITPIGSIEYDDGLDFDRVDYQGDLTSVDYNALARPGAVGVTIGHLLFLQSFLTPEKVAEHADNSTVPDHGPQNANLADDEVIDLGAHVINQHGQYNYYVTGDTDELWFRVDSPHAIRTYEQASNLRSILVQGTNKTLDQLIPYSCFFEGVVVHQNRNIIRYAH